MSSTPSNPYVSFVLISIRFSSGECGTVWVPVPQGEDPRETLATLRKNWEENTDRFFACGEDYWINTDEVASIAMGVQE